MHLTLMDLERVNSCANFIIFSQFFVRLGLDLVTAGDRFDYNATIKDQTRSFPYKYY